MVEDGLMIPWGRLTEAEQVEEEPETETESQRSRVTQRIRRAKMNGDPVHVSSHCVKTETENGRRPPQHIGSDCVKIRNYRAAVVCLVLLCVLLLTAVIVLCIHIHTNGTNYTEDRDEQLTNITNLTKERDQLLTRNTDLTKERDQLLTRNTDLTKERDQLLTRNTDLTKERDQLLTRNTNLTKERDQLLTRNTDLTKERDHLRERDGWTYYRSNFYYISSQKKSWYESRRYCTDKGADLIIINNREEQDFVKKLSCGSNVWIGLTDRQVEGTWKWVDGSTPSYRFWESGEPNSNAGDEDCALIRLGWADYPCNSNFQWICEKSFLK
ncbi:uncharacterized protein [Garra rufa]|uniref:uncharacterized protein n=1 Tax=Garra rufa TaxID=137080 RepID=UPI003CCE71CB